MIHDIDYLDIVISRNCQLACEGCLVFSDNPSVKKHFSVESEKNVIKKWASKLNPKTIHLFGGEPLMNPEFLNWVKFISEVFNGKIINVQTNGLKLSDILLDDLKNLVFNLDVMFSISIHSKDENYLKKVNLGIDKLKSLFPNGGTEEWIDDSEWVYNTETGLGFRVVEWWRRPWVSHYQGYGKSIHPAHEWNSDRYPELHGFCEAKNYIQLYKGKLWKCPTIAVLKDSLKMIGTNTNQWEPWFNYFALDSEANDEMIRSWLEQQKKPERICNMCFGKPRPIKEHFIKIKESKYV